MKCVHDINFGVEHTWGNKLNSIEYQKLKYVVKPNIYGDMEQQRSDFFKSLDDIVESVQNDSDCIETPTNQFSIKELKKYSENYIAIQKLMLNKHLKESSNYKTIEDEGGGHIHLSTAILERRTNFDRFLKNMYIFSINYPELNWIFNNPFDKDNANSLLNCNYEWHSTLREPDDYEVDKTYPIIYRSMYDTIEFRFFMMHRSLEESLLHLRIAVSIYNYLFKITDNDKKIYLKYTDVDQFPKTYNQAKNNALELFKLLKLSKEDIKYIKKERFGFMKHRFESDKYYKKRSLCC